MMYLYQFGQISANGYRDSVYTRYFLSELDFQSAGVTLKKGQGHQSLIISFPFTNNVYVLI